MLRVTGYEFRKIFFDTHLATRNLFTTLIEHFPFFISSFPFPDYSILSN